MSTQVPVAATPWRIPDDGITLTSANGTIFNGKAVKQGNKAVRLPEALYQYAWAAARFFQETAIHVVNIECMEGNASRPSIVFADNLHASAVGHATGSRIYHIQVLKG